jgi:hypothetical protein
MASEVDMRIAHPLPSARSVTGPLASVTVVRPPAPEAPRAAPAVLIVRPAGTSAAQGVAPPLSASEPSRVSILAARVGPSQGVARMSAPASTPAPARRGGCGCGGRR